MNTKIDYIELIREHNLHSMIVNPDGLAVAMDKCYEQGKLDGEEELLNWLSKMDYLSDNMEYIIEEWKNLKNDN